VVAIPLAALGNDGWGLVVARLGGPEFAARWTAALTAPPVEEIVKGLGVVMLWLIARDEVDDLMDGFVYGAMVGLGFAVVEDVVYFVGVFGGSTKAVLGGFLLRVVASGLYGHVLYTGLVGMAVGLVAGRRRAADPGTPRWTAAAALAGAALAGHVLWNSPVLDLFPAQPWSGADWLLVLLATTVKSLPLLVFVGLALRLARRREERGRDAALADEVGEGGISPAELGVLRDPRRRRAARAAMRRRAGARAARLLRRLQREQVNLAMLRSRVSDEADPSIVRQRAYCRSVRDALSAIPGAASADPAPTGG
jgi:hypothetical protein